jgi:HD-like signal output (HDOD) protein
VGTVTARRVLMAAVLRPLFASSGLRRHWSHAMRSAHYCSELARRTTFLSEGEGLILGLLHDLGALATEFLDRERRNARARLEERGCPAAYTEKLFFGADHGEIGSRILGGWGFPEHLVDAVRYHHQPERSDGPLAAFLYLAEFWSGQDEDLPSFYRVDHSLARTGLSVESLTQVRSSDDTFKALSSVA